VHERYGRPEGHARRWPADGVVPLSPTFDTPGLLARSVCDVAYGFAALDPAGIDPGGFIARAGARDLAGVRIGVGDPFLWRDCDPGSPRPSMRR
jgi:aspartyl-tRNA(Asn)/glutamyl-tRNA(Gln) amidotransferase subunit A